MNGLEHENFYLLDNQEYVLEKNKNILNIVGKREGKSFLTIEELQEIIDEVTQLFEIKYPNNLLYEIMHIANKNVEEIKKCLKITRQLDMKQFRYRIYHLDKFLDCPYATYFTLKKNKKEWYESGQEMIYVEEDGRIEERELNKLKEEGYLEDIYGVYKMEDLLGRFIGSPNNVDYSELREFVINHRNALEVRNKILEIIPLSMIYSKKSMPEYGYIRAKRFIRMINKELDFNLSTDKIDKIMNVDYSDTKKVKQLAKNINY